MSQKANYFKLGLFIIIASVLGAIFLIVFGAGEFFKKEMLAETCFDESVQGLSVGSQVKYKGIQIGTVKSITSAAQTYETKSDYVLVVMSLDQGIYLGQTGDSAKTRVFNAINDGLTVRLAFKGLTGAAFLETDYSKNAARNSLEISWAPKNIYIPSHKSNMKQIGDSINQILDNLAGLNIKEMALDMETLLKNLDKKLNDIDAKHISTLTASLLNELKATNEKFNSAIGSVKIQQIIDDATVSFSQLKTIIEDSKKPLYNAINDFEKAAGSTKEITSEFQAKLVPGIDSLSSNLDKFMENLAATSGTLENMVWMNSDKIKLIIENLETTSQNLKQLSKDIKKYPGRLLFEKPPNKLEMGKTDMEKQQ